MDQRTLRLDNLQKAMSMAARDLHKSSDAIINYLEGNSILDEDSADADEARVALENARRWRAICECGSYA